MIEIVGIWEVIDKNLNLFMIKNDKNFFMQNQKCQQCSKNFTFIKNFL